MLSMVGAFLQGGGFLFDRRPHRFLFGRIVIGERTL